MMLILSLGSGRTSAASMRIDGQQGAGAAAARPAAQRRTDTGRLSCLARNGGTPGEESRSWPLRRSGPAQRLADRRSEEHTSELQSLMRISYAVFCLKKKKKHTNKKQTRHNI